MEPLTLAPAVSGSSKPGHRQSNLAVPVKALAKMPPRKLPPVPTMASGKAPKTKPCYGMTEPIKKGNHGTVLFLTG